MTDLGGEAREIARVLTRSQREALLMLPESEHLAARGTRAMATLDHPRIHRGRPLAYSHGVTPFWSISKFGLRVRAALTEMEARGDGA